MGIATFYEFGLDVGDGCKTGAFDADGVDVDVDVGIEAVDDGDCVGTGLGVGEYWALSLRR